MREGNFRATSVSDLSRERSTFPTAKPTGQERIIGKDFTKVQFAITCLFIVNKLRATDSNISPDE